MRSIPALAGDGIELLEHLLIDRLMKVAIVVIALAVLALGMVIIWRIGGRRR
ncbi:hypothetical protein ABT297_40010 [Dactylosporangium sp. NPDC000555]|uniref:hypothetical protein n=1 Tax=Dactylosporangium sp. NPDC000555 TaxID=3154260 RepID=UPI00332004E3